MDIRTLITIDEDILGGLPVFSGTRVSIESLFDHIEAGVSLDTFLDDFPSVSRQQVTDLLEAAYKLLTSKDIQSLYATVA